MSPADDDCCDPHRLTVRDLAAWEIVWGVLFVALNWLGLYVVTACLFVWR